MMWLLLGLAFARESVTVDEPMVFIPPVVIDNVRYESAEPLYLFPTPDFDLCLVNTEQATSCAQVARRLSDRLDAIERAWKRETAEATEALLSCSTTLAEVQQWQAEDRYREEVLRLRLKRVRTQRNVLVAGVGSVVLVGGLVLFAAM